MLETLWIILFIIAILLIVIVAELEYNDFPYYWGLMLTLLDTIMWFVLSASVFEIEKPWAMYNVSSSQIETGIHIVTSKVSPEMSYFCLMMAIAMMVYMGYAVFSTFKQLYDEDGIPLNRWRRR
jgi:hypothetical protein